MRRLLLFVAAVALINCKGSTGPSGGSRSPYLITVDHSTHSGGGGTPYVTNITLLVTDTGTGTPHAGVGVTLQVNGGNITSPLPNITDGSGLTDVVWSVDTAAQTPGASYTLGYCAVPPGKTFCKTSLIGSQIVTVGPF